MPLLKSMNSNMSWIIGIFFLIVIICFGIFIYYKYSKQTNSPSMFSDFPYGFSVGNEKRMYMYDPSSSNQFSVIKN